MIIKAKFLKHGDKIIVDGSQLLVDCVVDLAPVNSLMQVHFKPPSETYIYLYDTQEVEVIPALPEKDGSLITNVKTIDDCQMYPDDAVFVRRGNYFFHDPGTIFVDDEIVSFWHYED